MARLPEPLRRELLDLVDRYGVQAIRDEVGVRSDASVARAAAGLDQHHGTVTTFAIYLERRRGTIGGDPLPPIAHGAVDVDG